MKRTELLKTGIINGNVLYMTSRDHRCLCKV